MNVTGQGGLPVAPAVRKARAAQVPGPGDHVDQRPC